jgi:hypothetical protein
VILLKCEYGFPLISVELVRYSNLWISICLRRRGPEHSLPPQDREYEVALVVLLHTIMGLKMASILEVLNGRIQGDEISFGDKLGDAKENV